MTRRVLLVAVAAVLGSCTVGPDYKRPSVAAPASFRAPEPLPATQAASLASSKWFEIFKDDKLQELIRRALDQNYDLRDAVARVEAARAEFGITRSAQFPNFDANGAVEINRLSRDGATPLPPQLLSSQNRNFGEAKLVLLSFEIDIWGRLRRATEAARANLLSADENRKAVITTLVSDVAYRLHLHARTRLRIGDFEADARYAPTIARTYKIAANRRRIDSPRPPAGRAAGGHGGPDHHGHSAEHRTNRESASAPAGRKSWRSHTRKNPNGAGFASRSACPFAFGIAGTEAGYPRGGRRH